MDEWPPPEPDTLPEELIHLVKPELQPGERLLWTSRAGAGAPSTALWPSSWSAWIWFFGFVAVGVCCLGLSNNQRPGVDGLLAAIGVLSEITALFFVVGFVSNCFSRWDERRKMTGQVYALTDRRAVIWAPAKRSAVSVHTFQRGTIRAEVLHRVQYPDGSGDISFRVSYQEPSGFRGIAEVRRVEELIRRFLVVPGQGPEPSEESQPD